MSEIRHATCNLCEAVCGIAVELDGRTIRGIRPDPDDPFSRGHICPKAVALRDLYDDPDRLRRPLRRTAAGSWEELDWDDALAEASGRLAYVAARHGRDAVALYQGNPVAHNLGLLLVVSQLHRALGTANRFSSSSVDDLPLALAAWAMFGSRFLAPVPDIDRCDYLLLLGANPAVSNGSAMTAPGAAARIRAVRERGGAVVLLDPRRTESAALASRHVSIRPNTDAWFLLGVLHVLFAERLARPGRLHPRMEGLGTLRALAARFPPARVARVTGVPAGHIADIAREFAAARAAVCHGRIGASTQAFGAVVHWLMTALNAVTGNLDREGGAMFARPAVDMVRLARLTGLAGSFATRRSRVRALPEFGGEFPVATLADEIITEGPGQVRALVTLAGNPVLSSPNGARLERALGGLECLVAVDYYLNETTRHAHVILPPVSPLERDHYDLLYYNFATRNAAKFAPAVVPRAPDARHDWEVVTELALRLEESRLRPALGAAGARWYARARRWIAAQLPPTRMLDVALRTGPHGLSLAALRARPHGVDLGPLVPCLPERLQNPARRVELAPALFVADVARLEAHETAGPPAGALYLVGRRELRSNNSWLHNSERLVKGPERCTLLMHPDDAAARGLTHGRRVRVASRTGAVEVRLEVTDAMRPGVVSLPHGWGHHRPGVRLRVAQVRPGVSANDLTDETVLDELSGAAGFSAVTVRVDAAG